MIHATVICAHPLELGGERAAMYAGIARGQEELS